MPSHRTLEEIYVDVEKAMNASDAAGLLALSAELLESDDEVTLARGHNVVGAARFMTGEYELALEGYRHALEIFEKLDEQVRAAQVHGNIGIVFMRTGNYACAIEHCTKALNLLEQLDDLLGMANVLMYIGNVYTRTGDYPQALAFVQRSLDIREQLADKKGAARAYSNLGNIAQQTGDHQQALAHYQHALALQEDIGDPSLRASIYGNMGTVLQHTGQLTEALEYHRLALDIHEGVGDAASVALDIGNIVEALIILGEFTDAQSWLDKLAGAHLKDPRTRTVMFAHRASIAQHNNNLEGARQHLLESLDIATEAGIRAEQVELHLRLRELARERNDFDGYIKHNTEYQRLSEEIRGKEATQKLAMMEAGRKMEAERREREKERAVLYSTLPKHVADRVVRGEKVNGDNFEHAAIMFADVVGFTSHTATMNAGDVVALLEHMFSTFDSVCELHGVTKIKTIGDSYMCFKGDAGGSENALALANVALAMMRTPLYWPTSEVAVIPRSDATRDLIQLRIGLHIGPVTAGVIGTQRLQYDVWGDTVNVASRLESTSEPGRIHVSEAFAALVIPSEARELRAALVIPSEAIELSLKPRGEIELKGKGTIATFWLEGV